MKHSLFAIALATLAGTAAAQAQVCPAGNLNYWQAFPPGGGGSRGGRAGRKAGGAQIRSAKI